MEVLANTEKGSFIFPSKETAADCFGVDVFFIDRSIRFSTPIFWNDLAIFVDEIEVTRNQ